MDGDLEDELSLTSAAERVKMIVEHFGIDYVTLLTSFGVQSGVMLSLGKSISYVKYAHIMYIGSDNSN